MAFEVVAEQRRPAPRAEAALQMRKLARHRRWCGGIEFPLLRRSVGLEEKKECIFGQALRTIRWRAA